ncbi:glyoxalase [Salipiger thiooxidans]|nr:VOC family protein [Salipiger thiooxidans]MCA0851569.1 glyoxalase [Salipiger thiooxidans]
MVAMNETLAGQVECYGVILFTEKFDECVAFYREKLGLPFWYEKEGLCCLRFGAAYLMIESGGAAQDRRKNRSENPTVIRFNVPDVAAAAIMLEAQGIHVETKHHSWGVTGSFTDPDGNVCSLKNADDPFFHDTQM